MLILGIESSCDETAAAVMADGGRLLSNVVDTQIDIHSRYGGVVPELASRRHLETIHGVVSRALAEAEVDLADLDAIAVTRGPGLVGSLLVGYSFAKAVCQVRKIPCLGVDHLAGHLLSVFLAGEKPEFPYAALAVSGGHSSLYRVEDFDRFLVLGRTRDDAAGEAFDKVAKLLELGYPGGPVISRLAATGNPGAIAFPRAWLDQESLDFSFSGLKTAVMNHVHRARQQGEPLLVADICASFQEAVVEVLVEKTFRAALNENLATVAVVGGVAANGRLREKMVQRGLETDIRVCLPPPEFCTDNAAMIALAGYHLLRRGQAGDALDADVYSRSPWPLRPPSGAAAAGALS